MKIQRIHEIEEYLKIKETATLDELCQAFNVSKNTIRRDTKYLIDKGILEKVYGGVILKNNSLVSFEHREVTKLNEKTLIAKKSAEFIEPNDYIYIDSGTTTMNILDYIDQTLPLTVITNNLDVINFAVELENVQLITIGNKYKKETRSFLELNNSDILKSLNVNKAFMASTGVSLKSGLTNSDILETRIKKAVSDKAETLFLLADDSKFDHATLSTYADLKEVDHIISGGELPSKYIEYFSQNKINLELVY
ncbi:DeoR/GlpR family DNA-binding transcription regulator [Vagococcus sp. PNs007]|uniref:DeoR/GlpR family DNA-binding transcription regulator n=1 Tax=Vagococcus proximus TaxID=2991417 RepID=A0ABT5X238_9ENTE|nr:DeoR/GlpR family DNA-binding transcription regulator [Vagococcus proximus]MDF0480062.1 DeoR/GlpR family DNA-binding transcription regulator [Vagococcus proximus]